MAAAGAPVEKLTERQRASPHPPAKVMRAPPALPRPHRSRSTATTPPSGRSTNRGKTTSAPSSTTTANPKLFIPRRPSTRPSPAPPPSVIPSSGAVLHITRDVVVEGAANDNPQPQGAELSSYDDNSPLVPLAPTGTDVTTSATSSAQ